MRFTKSIALVHKEELPKKYANEQRGMIPMSAVEAEKGRIGSPAETYSIYACPTCKQELELRDVALRCRVCAMTYPILEGIPKVEE